MRLLSRETSHSKISCNSLAASRVTYSLVRLTRQKSLSASRRASAVVARTSTTPLLMLRMMKRQKARISQASSRKKMSMMTTLPSSRSKKKRRSNSASRLKKNVSDRRLLKPSVAPNLPKLKDYVKKLRLQLNRPASRLTKRKLAFRVFKSRKSCNA